MSGRAVSAKDHVYLEVLYQGSYQCKEWLVEAVGIKMGNVTHEISAGINTNCTAEELQLLPITLIHKKSCVRKTHSNINFPPKCMRAMEISAVLFRTQVHCDPLKCSSDESEQVQILSERCEQRIDSPNLPVLSSGKMYQLKIVHGRDFCFYATLSEKVTTCTLRVLPAKPAAAESKTDSLAADLDKAQQALAQAGTHYAQALAIKNQSQIDKALLAQQRALSELMRLRQLVTSHSSTL